MKAGIAILKLLGLLCLAAWASPQAPRRDPPGRAGAGIVLKGGRVVTASGAIIERGILVIRDGTIDAVGRDAVAPAGVEIVDVAGRTVMPGFIDGFTTLGTADLPSFGSDEDEAAEPLMPHLRVIDALNPESRFIGRALREGITAAVSAPADVNLLSGQSAVIRLAAGPLEQMLVRFPIGVHATIGEAPKLRFGAKGKAPATRMGEIALLRQAFIDAQEYLQKKERAAGQPGAAPPVDLKLEALAPVVRGELPLIVSADKREDILAAVRLADEFRLRLIINHGAEAYRATAELAARGIPVILGPASQAGLRLETMQARSDAAVLLYRAGVRFAFQSGARGNSAELLAQARTAVANGLPAEEAVRALTLQAARIFGVADRLGSLEPGKAGDVLVFEGDPLRALARLEMVIVGGRRR